MSASTATIQQLLINVFVYGTLKRGQPNHHWLSDSAGAAAGLGAPATFVANGRTTQKFPLVVGTRYNIPFLLERPGTGHLVHGEVYAVDAAKLAHLDVLEDYPQFYGRQQQSIELLTTQSTDPTNQSSTPAETLTCWVYLLPTFPATMLQKPMLASYADSADQPYQIGSVRLPTLRAADDLAF